MIKKAVFTLLAAVALSTGASAQILTAFDVSGVGNTGNLVSPTPVVDPSVTATGLARTTVIASAANNSFSSNTWNITNTFSRTTNFISFTMTAGAADVTVSSLGYATNGSATAPGTGMWSYTVDGTNFVDQTPFTNLAAQPTARSLWDFTDFTLTATTTVTFRFYEFGATSINGGTSAAAGTTRIANITAPSATQYDLVVNGPNAAVEPLNPAAAPEPSVMAIMAAAVGLFGFMIYRRNQAA